MTQTVASIQDKTPEELSYELAILLGVWPDALPPYSTSYDAIIGEIHKLGHRWADFITNIAAVVNVGPIQDVQRQMWLIMTASPADLTRALILTKQINEETK